MKLKVMAISDTHLGEDSSVLSYPLGRQYLWRELRKIFGEGKTETEKLSESGRFCVDELILIGDIPDRTLSSTSQITEYTNAFMRTLGSAAKIKKVVYVPGNHDHTVWTNYIQPKGSDITEPKGETILSRNMPFSHSSIGEGTKELLGIFFGYRHGSLWRAIEKKINLEFVIANPLYATKLGSRTYVFAHGTHFRGEPSWGTNFWKWARFVFQDDLGKKIDPGKDIKNAKNLKQLEEFVTPLVDSLWYSPGNNPTSLSDHAWWIFGRAGKKSKSSGLISWITNDSFTSIERFGNIFYGKMMDYLEGKKDQNGRKFLERGTETIFIYGDTHEGGEFEHKGISIFNCGGWTVHDKERAPDCRIFVAYEEKKNGVIVPKEELVPIDFDKYTKDNNMEIYGREIYELAGKEFEHQGTSFLKVMLPGILPRFILALLPYIIIST